MSAFSLNAVAQGGDCAAYAGTLSSDQTAVCLPIGGAMLSAMASGDALIPEGYVTLYVLTTGEDMVITESGTTADFTISTLGLHTIHTLVYDPATLDLTTIVYGETTAAEVNALLIQGGGTICASLDLAGVTIMVDDPDAGGLTAVAAELCLGDSATMISAIPDGDAYVPDGYSLRFVLTMGEGLVIMDAGEVPQFVVEFPGMYTIHTLVYDPMILDLSMVVPGVTTGFDVHALFVQGGGSICGSLDAGGAMVNVIECDGSCTAAAGGLMAMDSQVCLVDSTVMIGATPNGGMVVPEGYSTIYVLTMGAGMTIQATAATPSFSVDMVGSYYIHTLVYDPMTLDLSLVVPGVTTGSDVHGMLTQGGGEICGAIDLEGAPVMVIMCDDPCMAHAGALSATSGQVCFDDGMAMVSATHSGGMVPEGYMTKYVLTMGADMVIHAVADAPSFSVDMAGMYTIHTLVYDPATLDLSIVVPGVTTAATVNGLLIQGGGEVCAALDLIGVMVNVIVCDDECAAWSGSLLPLKSVFCVIETGSVIGAIVVGNAVVPPGYQIKYIATHGEDMIIEGVSDAAWFNVSGMGLYTIHSLVYDPATLDLSLIQLGVTSASNVNAMLIQGGGSICASLDLTGVSMVVEDPMTPTLTASAGTVCFEGGSATVAATAGSDMYLPTGYTYTYILTEGDTHVIKEFSMTPSFEVMEPGHYTIHTLVYDADDLPLAQFTPGVSTAYDVNAILVQGGGIYCAVLDMLGATVYVIDCDDECGAWAGSLVGLKNVFCYIETGSVIGATVVGDAVVPAGYQIKWIATHGTDLIIENISEMAWFNVSGMGLYTIHTLVYDPSTLDLSMIQFGVTSAYDVHAMLTQGGGSICGSLDMGGVPMIVDDPTPPTLTAVSSSVCHTGGSTMIGATVGLDMNLPMDYTFQYVLTQGEAMVIMEISDTPSFEVMGLGHYTIHTLLYDPFTFPVDQFIPGVSTAYDINAILVQGGGIYCAALDMTGASVHVIDCGGTPCTAAAGTLTADDLETCLDGGSVTITATGDMNMVVPAGYMVHYALTSGMDATIMYLSDDLSFTVTTPGSYAFHTLVYDPMTLDLASVVPGTTTGGDIHAMLIQGGGSICGSLDLTGASTLVIDCTIDCTSDAGSILPDTVGHCLMEGSAMLVATAGGDMVVPDGYSVFYVLTKGLSPVVYDVSATPSFTVTSEDIYRIHTLVYDPLTLDLTLITLGVTTAMEVNAMLIQGGGSICASLNILGALFTVVDCSDCLAFAGTLTADTVEVCLEDSMVWLNATAAGDAVIPEGSTAIYVLTHTGTLTIVDVSETPNLWVDMEGSYTIHTLVYDPLTLNLGFVIPGETTAAEVMAYIEANQGLICASLDLTGVTFTVIDCSDGEGMTITNAWPVPASEQLTVQVNVPTTASAEMMVFDMNGAQVLPSRTIAKGTNQVVLNVSGLETGFYTIRMLGVDGVATYSFTKGN